MIPTLKDALADWTDPDQAAFLLGRCLGVFGPDITGVYAVKGELWSNHSDAGFLYQILDGLVKSNVLQFDAEETRYRWNPLFRDLA